MSEQRFDQGRVTITDPQVMRALAHPARLRIMEHLQSTGASVSATECAEVVGLSPSATSYHLRALARFGLVEEAPGRGDARERLWRGTVQPWQFAAGQSAGPEARAAEGALVEAFLARDIERARDWVRRASDEPPEWYDVATLSDVMLLVTAEELAELNAAVRELLEPYRRRHRVADPPPGARPVAVQYRAVPME
ncbi:helix-turn-helix domain-containing protein [Micromonospora sp. NPDC049559]|uniref:ArsR/SmtB family transcription factor n=1 Tax=Micromonospora sp. NPDC049559 TaxID=3155923 RepID=UPI003442C023